MITIGEIKINFYRYIGLILVRQAMKNTFNIQFHWSAELMIILSIILLSIEELDE